MCNIGNFTLVNVYFWTVKHLLVVTTALFNFFMVMFRHRQHLAKLSENLWKTKPQSFTNLKEDIILFVWFSVMLFYDNIISILNIPNTFQNICKNDFWESKSGLQPALNASFATFFSTLPTCWCQLVIHAHIWSSVP